MLKNMEEKPLYCGNCHRNIPSGNFIIHSSYCEKNIQLCRLCNEPVPRSELTKHLDEDHKLDHCVFCKNVYEVWLMDSHQAECNKKPTPCKYCELTYPFDELSDHKSHCGSRTEKCAFCDKYVQLKEKDNHAGICQKIECQKRMISCEYCSLEFADEIYEEHVLSCGSRTEECLCGAFVMIKNKRHHESTCKQRKDVKKQDVYCRYCGDGFHSDFLQNHEDNCDSRTEQCYRCNEFVKLNDFDHHRKLCSKKKNVQKEDVCCRYCGDRFEYDFLQNHENICDSRPEQCYWCYEFVKLKDICNHQNHCFKKNVKMHDVCCRYCGDGFHSDFLQNHEDNCDSRVELCYRCNEFIKLKDFDHHRNFCSKKKDVQKQDVCCRYCGDRFHSDFIQNHEDNCDSRVELCYRCNEFVKLKDFDHHRKLCSKKKDVQKQDVCCRYCGDRFHSDFIQNHEDNCDSRVEQCYRCNEFVKLKDFDHHRKLCSKDNPKKVNNGIEVKPDYNSIEPAEEAYDAIPVPCPFCKVNFPPDCLQEHIETCGETIENCPICQMNITYKDKANHHITCKEVDSDQICPICDVKFSSSGFKIHYEVCFEANCIYFHKEQNSTEAYQSDKQEFMDFTENTGVIKDSKVSGTQFKSCPYCSKEIIERLYDNHMIYCPKALKMCPFCEETFHCENEVRHVENCPSLEEMEFLKSHRDTKKSQYNSRKGVSYKKTESKYKMCLHCNARIEENEYKEHTEICCNNLKECKFCHSFFKATNESNHLRNCSKIPRGTTDKFLYEGLSADQTSKNKKKMKGKELEKCSICLNKIPKEKLKSHRDDCVKSYRYCNFCYEKYHINKEQEHMKKCSKICHSKDSDTGAKPKTYGVGKLFSSVTRLFSGENDPYKQERENSTNGVDTNRSNVSPKIESQAKSCIGTEFQSVQYLNQISCMPCEFCKRSIPFEEIVRHETGCRPDLLSLPPKANESLPCTKLTDESRECIPEDMINEEQKYSSKSSTKNQSDYGTHLGNKSRNEENYSYVEKFYEKYNESCTLPNKSIVSIYPTIMGSMIKEESDYTMARAKKECLALNIDRNKHKQYFQNSYSNNKNVPTELVSKENYFHSENSMKNYRKANFLPEKYYAGTQENQNVHKDAKILHNEMENAGNECLTSNIDNKNYKEYFQISYSDNKTVPTELVSKESYFYSENSNRKYKGNNFPEKCYSENIPQRNQNLPEHVKSIKDEVSEKSEMMNYLKMKNLVYLSENPHTKNMKEIAPNVTHEESKKYISNTFEASELFPAQNLSSVDMTKSDESFAETKKIKKLKPSPDVSLHQIKKFEFSSINEKNSSKSNESDKSDDLHIMWQKIDSETIEYLQSKSLKSSFGSCQEKLSASEVNILQQNAYISDLSHSTVSCATADDALGKISNVTQNDIENLKSSELELPMAKRQSVNDNFLDESEFKSTQKTKAYVNLSNDDDNIELTSSKINDRYKIDELILKKRKQTQLVDSDKKYKHPYQDSLNLRNANFPYGLHNQSLINRPQKDESQNFHGIAETKSNFSLTIPDSSKIFLEKDENNRLNYNSSTKPLDQQMNNLSIKHMAEKKYDGIEQSGIKDNSLDSYLHFLDFDTSDRHTNEICNVCANEMCLCQIKESINAEREKSQCFPETSENRADPMMEAKKGPADVWNKWRESASDSE